jgi:hypothetical protein
MCCRRRGGSLHHRARAWSMHHAYKQVALHTALQISARLRAAAALWLCSWSGQAPLSEDWSQRRITDVLAFCAPQVASCWASAPSLTALTLASCALPEGLSDLPLHRSLLRDVCIERCTNLAALSDLRHLTALTCLELLGCEAPQALQLPSGLTTMLEGSHGTTWRAR